MKYIILLFLAAVVACSFTRVSLTDEEKQKIIKPPKEIKHYVSQHIDAVHEFMGNHYQQFPLQDQRVLTECMQEAASFLGVVNADKVRVIVTNNLPIPEEGTDLYEVYLKIAGDPKHAGAITVGHYIFIKPMYSRSYHILLHELVHVMQYEKFGSKAFLEKYMTDAQIVAYSQIPFESEAFVIAATIQKSGLKKCAQLYLD